MRIQRLDPSGRPADLAAALPLFREYLAGAMPGFPLAGPTRLRFSSVDGYRQRTRAYGVFADEASGPSALLFMYYGDDSNLDMANAFLVLPAAQRDTELGEFLVREALRLAAAEGRSRVVTDDSSARDSEPFFTRLGGRKVLTSTRSVLDLSTVDGAQYEAWAAGSAKNADYRLVRWVDHCPDELAEAFCEATEAMRDAPLEDLAYEHAKPTLERLRANEEQTVAFGIRRRVQAAVAPDGGVAGFSMFVTAPDEPEAVDIWDTAVVGGHRGHGLGLRIKAAAGLWMLQDLPSARWVHTFNNHDNTHMLAVNRALGYRKSEDWPCFEFATGA
jgi:hypothetical protein